MNICPLKIFRPIYRFASYDIKKKSHYEILGIAKNATDEEIKRAFLNKSRELHPDGDLFKEGREKPKNKSHWSVKSKTHSFMELKEAYDVLRKDEKRKEYDSQLFDLESKDGYLMSVNKKNNILSRSFSTGAPSSSGGGGENRNPAGHFINPNELYEKEEKNKRYFKYGAIITVVAIIANILYVDFLTKKKAIIKERNNLKQVGLV
uniref:J domain-containing protein n=1 Tax=Parastrongyloides trichosuri TaxID=131310 RepID=A0A0N4ZQI8_PARTI